MVCIAFDALTSHRGETMTIDWDDVEAWENGQDYRAGYAAAINAKRVPKWATDAFLDGYEEGQCELLAQREEQRQRNQVARTKVARQRKVDPYRTVRPVTVTEPLLRKASK
jgi:hypothetical protein